MLVDLLKAALATAVTVSTGAMLKCVVEGVGARRAAPSVSLVVLPPGVRLEPRPAQAPRQLGPVALMSRLPPVPRRTNPWLAALAGSFGGGVGVGAYFRTRTDTAVAAGLCFALVMALGVGPEYETPAWQLALIYGTMALGALYSALRALASNRSRERGARRSAAERKLILQRELDALAARRCRIESVGEYEALVARLARPNHWLHLLLSVLTFQLWVPVWIAVTRSRRRNPRWDYYRLFVDARGNPTTQPVA